MLTYGLYDKPISNTFVDKISAISQKIKPMVIAHWLDSRHIDKVDANTEIASSNATYATPTNNDIINEAYGMLSESRSLSDNEILFNKSKRADFYFTPNESINGIERESFPWAVAGAKDVNGNIITANGNWHCLPTSSSSKTNVLDLDDNFEFGYWSSYKSTSNLHATRNGYEFSTPVVLTYLFTARPVNLIKIITSEHYGQIKSYNIKAYVNTSTLVFDQDGEIPEDNYYFTHYLEGISNSAINKILVTVYTTKNPLDNARVQEMCPIYEVDMTDYVIDVSVSKVRDVHETSLPIAGGGSSTASISFNNNSKNFNIFSSNSLFGKYMKKDLKFFIYGGWQIQKTNDYEISTFLTSSINANSNTIPVGTTIGFPDGGGNNNFILTIDKNTINREYVLCSKNSPFLFNAVQRGYGDSIARSHNANATVHFDTFEYVPYGVFYIDEWQAASSSMVVSASLTNWSKFLNEKTFTKGFFIQDSTIPFATKNILMSSNFPEKDIIYLSKPSESYTRNNAILHYNFNENIVDRDNATRTVASSLRARFVEVTSNDLVGLKDILLDANDKDLTVMEKALDIKAYFTPSLTTVSNTISTQDQAYPVALNFTTGTFTKNAGGTVTQFYNGVFDGFYIPDTSGNQSLMILINRGGVRVYLDKVLIINDWYSVESGTNSTVTLESDNYNLTAGKMYELRIEFFTGALKTGAPFQIKLKRNDSNGIDWVYSDQTITMAALDRIGSRSNQSYLSFNSGTGRWSVVPSQNQIERASRRNNAIYVGNPTLAQPGGVVSDTDNKSLLLSSNSYLRIPYDISYNVFESNSHTYTGDFTISTYVKFNANSFSGNGEFISNWNNSTPNSGFELFYNSSMHGMKVITSSGTEIISSNTALSSSSFYLMSFALKGNILKYYVNGVLANTITLTGTPISYSNKDLCIGGRGASYASGAEVAPSTIREFTIDEFVIFNTSLSDEQNLNNYIETQMQPSDVFPFIYGNDTTAQSIIDSISLADLGRLYIDENEKARYEHYYRFFETTIDQHANVQQIFSDTTNIIDASYNVQLQTNKVVVKISGVTNNLIARQSLWRAEDPTSLGTVNLESNITSTSNTLPVSTTDKPPFPKSGYLKIDNEIIKYSNTTSNAFLLAERAQFGTVAAAHSNNALVREVLSFDIKFDKSPAFRVQNPLITNLIEPSPPLIELVKFEPNHYGAKLIIAASNATTSGSLVYVEGEDVASNVKAFASIAGIPVVVTEAKGEVVEKVAKLDDNIRKYGLKELVIENEFISNLEKAQKIADFIINKMSEPVPIINLNILPNPRIQLGDRIKISSMDSFDIINGEYWVISTDCVFSDSPSQSIVVRKVV